MDERRTPWQTAALPVTSVEVFDIDGDGDNDVLAAVSTPTERVWRNNGLEFREAESRWTTVPTVRRSATAPPPIHSSPSTSTPTATSTSSRPRRKNHLVRERLHHQAHACTIGAPLVLAPADALVRPTPGPTVTFNPTPRPTFRPTNKQFHCESNVFGIPHVIDEPATGYLGADGCQSIFGVDLDGDYDIDFLSGSTQEVAWYANDGYEDFTKSVITSFTSAASVKKIFAADVDGDGEIDALSASYDDNTIAWYQNDAESFTKLDLKTDASGAICRVRDRRRRRPRHGRRRRRLHR